MTFFERLRMNIAKRIAGPEKGAPSIVPFTQVHMRLMGPNFSELEMMNVQHVATCVDIITKRCAATPMRLYARTKSKGPGKHLNYPHREISIQQKDFIASNLPATHKSWLSTAGDVEEIIDHPILDIFGNVNNGMDSPTDLLGYIVPQMLIVGNSLVYKLRGPLKAPMSLCTSDPAYWDIVPGPDNSIERYEFWKAGVPKPYDQADVIHFKLPDVRAGYWGVGVLARHYDSHRTDQAIRNYEQNTFKKAGFLTGLFTTDDERMSAAAAKEMAEQIRAIYTGDRAEKIGFLPKGITYQQLGQTMKDLAHLQGRNFTRAEISAAFQVPEAFLYLNSANLASAREARRMLAENAIWPILRKIEEVWNQRLVSEDFDENLLVMYDSPVPDDRDEDRADVRTYVSLGVLTPDEVRQQKLGMDPVNWAETYPGLIGATKPATVTPGSSNVPSGQQLMMLDEVTKMWTDRQLEVRKRTDAKLLPFENRIKDKSAELFDEMYAEVIDGLKKKPRG